MVEDQEGKWILFHFPFLRSPFSSLFLAEAVIQINIKSSFRDTAVTGICLVIRALPFAGICLSHTHVICSLLHRLQTPEFLLKFLPLCRISQYAYTLRFREYTVCDGALNTLVIAVLWPMVLCVCVCVCVCMHVCMYVRTYEGVSKSFRTELITK
jgi:hypothetical protein